MIKKHTNTTTMKKTFAFLFSLMLFAAVPATAHEFIELAADEEFSADMLATDDFESEDIFATDELVDEEPAEAEESFNPGSTIIGHVTDAHSWHMFDYFDKSGKEHAVAIPLPVILINNGHLDVFMSSKFHHGHADYKGYRLVGGGIEKEEIICVDEAGQPLLDEAGRSTSPSPRCLPPS